jgi:hypothetical protein
VRCEGRTERNGETVTGDITPLKYRIFRNALQLAGATLPDEGLHNQTIVRQLRSLHELVSGDVVVFDLAGDPKYSLAYEISSFGVSPIRLPEYARLAQ